MDLISSQKNLSTSQKNKQLVSSKADPISGFNSQLLKITAKSSTSRSSSGTSSSLKNGSKHGKKLGKKSETSQCTRRDTFDFEDSQDPFGSQEDPFAFDDGVGELMSKWDLMSGKKNSSQSQKSSSVFEEDEYGCKDIVLLSQQESSNTERHDSPPQASCSHVIDDEKLNLLADCLLASVKVKLIFLLKNLFQF